MKAHEIKMSNPPKPPKPKTYMGKEISDKVGELEAELRYRESQLDLINRFSEHEGEFKLMDHDRWGIDVTADDLKDDFVPMKYKEITARINTLSDKLDKINSITDDN